MGKTINQITDSKFKKYARVISGIDCTQLSQVMSETPITNGVSYVPILPELESLEIFNVFKDSVFAGMPIQLGYCNGKNKSLNAVEYHRSSEVVFAQTNLVTFFGLRQDIDNNTYDTALTEAFFIPAGTIIEIYATTLHFAPCNESPDGFQSAVILPKGTGEALTEKPKNTNEDDLLAGKNVWIICHPETDMAKQGFYAGLKNINPCID